MALSKITNRLLLNVWFMMLLSFLIFNFAYAPWSWNPIEDLFYVRSAGFLLPANHVSSALGVAITAFLFAARDLNNAFKWIPVIISTGSIHEFILDALNIPGFIANNSLSYTITFRWFFWLSVILGLGLFFATKKQRKVMGLIAVFCFLYIGTWIFVAGQLNIDTFTILAYAPGPAYHDFIPNFFEVSSWLIPISFWWFSVVKVKQWPEIKRWLWNTE